MTASSHPKLRGFMLGQFANLFKLAMWWTSLAPLMFAITDRPEAIGVSRICYNAALCLLSPVGPLVVERYAPKKILVNSAVLRFVIWTVLVPLEWCIFGTAAVGAENRSVVYAVTMVLMAVDGVAVAMSCMLDIDFCGIDVVAGMLGVEVTDDDRNYFNTRQELFFASCFVLFAPAMAYAGVALHKAGVAHLAGDGSDLSSRNLESGTLVLIFAVTFLVGLVFQAFFFRNMAPDEEEAGGEAEAGLLDHAGGGGDQLQLNEEEHSNAGGGEGPPPPLLVAIKAVPSELLAALKLICSHSPLLFRLVFLGLEIAFEDAIIVVVAAQMGIRLPWLGDGSAVNGNLWTAAAVGAGKLGGAVASFLMMKFFAPPKAVMGYWLLFVSIFFSGATVVAFPLVTAHQHDGTLSTFASRAIFFAAFFVYFLLSTLPKVGLMTLLQSMTNEIENGHRAFGFIAIVATTFDAVVIMLLSAVFMRHGAAASALDMPDFISSLWLVAYVYVAHGTLELICGPLLILRPVRHIPPAPGGPPEEGEDAEEGAEEAEPASVLLPPTRTPRSPRDGVATPRSVMKGVTRERRGSALGVGGAATPVGSALLHRGNLAGLRDN
jgi:hypothetical protein